MLNRDQLVGGLAGALLVLGGGGGWVALAGTPKDTQAALERDVAALEAKIDKILEGVTESRYALERHLDAPAHGGAVSRDQLALVWKELRLQLGEDALPPLHEVLR